MTTPNKSDGISLEAIAREIVVRHTWDLAGGDVTATNPESLIRSIAQALQSHTEELRSENKRLKAATEKALNVFWMRQSSAEGHSETYFAQSSKDLPLNLLQAALSHTNNKGIE
jgi:hypothetical protein